MMINYLAEAYAANVQQAYERRDHYLRLAHITSQEATSIILLKHN